jgi:hypothetical protein
MDDALGLVGLVAYIAAVIVLSAAVTFVVVKLTPDRPKKPREEGDSSAG